MLRRARSLRWTNLKLAQGRFIVPASPSSRFIETPPARFQRTHRSAPTLDAIYIGILLRSAGTALATDRISLLMVRFLTALPRSLLPKRKCLRADDHAI